MAKNVTIATLPRLSRKPKKNFATKRELSPAVYFTQHFRHYLLGQKITIVTDHRALWWFHSFKDPDGLTARWLEKIPPSTTWFDTKRENQLDKPMDCPAVLELECRYFTMIPKWLNFQKSSQQ